MATLYLIDDDINVGKDMSGEMNVGFKQGIYYSKAYSTLHFQEANNPARTAVLFLMHETTWTFNSSSGKWTIGYGCGLSYRKELTTNASDEVYINGTAYKISSFPERNKAEEATEPTIKWLIKVDATTLTPLNGSGGKWIAEARKFTTKGMPKGAPVSIYAPKMTWHYPKSKFTVTVDPGDCKVSSTSISTNYGKQFYLPSISKAAATSSFTRKLKFVDTLDASGNFETQSSECKTKTTYDDFYFKRNSDGTKVYPGEAQQWYYDDTITAKYGSSETTTTSEARVNYLPTQPVVNGYINKGWYTTPQWDQGERITTNTEVYKDSTFYSGRDGKVYSISFKLNPSGASFNGSDPGTIQKKFGTKEVAPTVIPTRFGYEFVGWHTNKDIGWFNPRYSNLDKGDIRKQSDWWNPAIIRPGQEMTTENFDKVFSVNGSNVILYTIWRPINHYISAKYYTWTGDEQDFVLREFKVRYTIENNIIDVRSPSVYNQPSMTGSWVFFGWKQPDDMSEFTDTHGIYRNINLIDNVQLPWSYASKFDGEWIEGNVTNTIYGFWTITGKYFCVDQNDWKKITCIYIKNDDGRWIPMNGTSSDNTSFSVNIDGTWKKEVYL